DALVRVPEVEPLLVRDRLVVDVEGVRVPDDRALDGQDRVHTVGVDALEARLLRAAERRRDRAAVHGDVGIEVGRAVAETGDGLHHLAATGAATAVGAGGRRDPGHRRITAGAVGHGAAAALVVPARIVRQVLAVVDVDDAVVGVGRLPQQLVVVAEALL